MQAFCTRIGYEQLERVREIDGISVMNSTRRLTNDTRSRLRISTFVPRIFLSFLLQVFQCDFFSHRCINSPSHRDPQVATYAV